VFTVKNKSTETTKLEELIEKVQTRMIDIEPDSTEFGILADQLYKLKETSVPNKRVSPDTLATIAANLAGILIVIGYERAHIITSKAFSSVLRIR
jgi:hypothetical protein